MKYLKYVQLRTFATQSSRRTAIGLVLLVVPLHLASAQSDGEQMARDLRQNTVRIQAGQRDGFGFIVGERSGYLYIATARHVLTADAPDALHTEVNVYFYSDQGTAAKAEMLGPHANDLGMVRVPKPRGLSWRKDCLPKTGQQARGTPVWFVGRNREWYVPVRSGTIVSDQPSTQSQIEVEYLQVAPGTSGAPLVAGSGFIGIIQNDSDVGTLVLTSDFIERAFKQVNYPWNLTASNTAGGTTSSELDLLKNSIKLTASADFAKFDYGFSAIGHDSEVKGSRLKIAKVTLRVSIRSYSQLICCDAWVLLAPSSDMFSAPGQIAAGPNPVLIQPHAPIQVQFVLGTGGAPVDPGVHTLEGTYDFETNLPSGQIDRMKTIIGRYIDLPDGLYAQIFFWNGNPNVNVEVESAKVHVDFASQGAVSFNLQRPAY